MNPADLWRLAFGALQARKMRTRLTMAAVAVGVGAVLVLTGLGEGARLWVEERFNSLGSNVLAVLPGRTETRGGATLLASGTRDLTLDDFHELSRRLPGVRRAVPLVIGETTASYGRRSRASAVVGSTNGFLELRRIPIASGQGLPESDARQGARVCVIGRTIAKELFAGENPLGERIRLGDHPFRVIGTVAETGQAQHANVDEMVLVPVSEALQIYDRRGLFRILLEVSAAADMDLAARRATEILKERHDGEEDFTLLTPGAVAASLLSVIRMITLALAGIAAISLTVAGIGVMNVMVVSVSERTPEIGLMKALGAGNGQVLLLFLAEAVLLSAFGGLIGTGAGLALTEGARLAWPQIPFRVPGWALMSALGVAVGVGIAFGLLPARRAARLEPLDALRRRA